MEKGAEKILAKHGCLYMKDDYKALFEELEAYYKPTEVVENINYDTVLDAVNCEVCGTKLSEQEKEGGNCCDECWLRN